MKKRFNNKKGFTLAEALIVVAIVLVLAAVAFIAVWVYQRSMHHLEMDEYAKEIFIAAQNHLSAAAGQGYLDAADTNGDFGQKESGIDDIYYFIVNQGTVIPDNAHHAVLDYMLPFASVDETVRTGYSYIIRYQKNPATVLDVFCASAYDKRFGIEFTSGNYSDVMGTKDTDTVNKRRDRRSFGDEKAVLGYYGGATADALSTVTLQAPKLIVHNEDVLWIQLYDPNYGKDHSYLNLIIEGETSDKKISYKIRTGGENGKFNPDEKNNIEEIKSDTDEFLYYKIILDDITNKDLRFTSLLGSEGFYLGENLNIQAVSFSNSALSNIAYSAAAKANSLFDDRSGDTVYIANARHLENLNESVSGFNRELNDTSTVDIDINKAEQRSDISWKDFTASTLTSGHQVYSNSAYLNDGNFEPVTIPSDGDDTAAFTYDGKGHQIASIKVDVSGNAGLFTSVSGDTISNLQLVDFTVNGTDAGALAGVSTNSKITNVVAYNKDADSETTATVTGTGSVGGLIGSATGSESEISKCAASLVVSTTGDNAGGLIGSATDGTVSASYSGGHTKDGAYTYVESNTTKYLYNVTGDKNVGGLIGSASGTSISNSYSTCSVQGTGKSSENANHISYVGGFVGSASGTMTITNSYSTGLVNSVRTTNETDVEGAFVGKLDLMSGEIQSCNYFEIINERDVPGGSNGNKGYTYLDPIGENTQSSAVNVTAIDENATAYEKFVNGTELEPKTWESAFAYDDILKTYYHDTNNQNKNTYNLKTVEQLGASVDDGDFVSNHYGDWPAPEVWVINEKN